MNSQPPTPRPFRRGICDGDDVWPVSLTDDDLESISAFDVVTLTAEREPPPALKDFFGGGPVWSLAEYVRSWRSVVDDTEFGCHLDPHEYISRIENRELLERHLAQLPDSLRAKLTQELLEPLDTRFETATSDDGGLALGREVNINQIDTQMRWWNRRPTRLGPLWTRAQTDVETIERRVRNRLMEYLEIASSFAEQRRYADLMPHVNVPYEVINQWEDWVPSGTFDPDASSGVFSVAEVEALVIYGTVWKRVADRIPSDYPSIEFVQNLAPWQELRSQAEATLRVLEILGRFQEETGPSSEDRDNPGGGQSG